MLHAVFIWYDAVLHACSDAGMCFMMSSNLLLDHTGSFCTRLSVTWICNWLYDCNQLSDIESSSLLVVNGSLLATV